MKNNSVLPKLEWGHSSTCSSFDISSPTPTSLQTVSPRSITLLDFIAALPNDVYHLLNIHDSRRGSPIVPFRFRLLDSIIFHILFPVHQEMMKDAEDLSGQGNYCYVMSTSCLDSKIESPELRAYFLRCCIGNLYKNPPHML